MMPSAMLGSILSFLELILLSLLDVDRGPPPVLNITFGKSHPQTEVERRIGLRG